MDERYIRNIPTLTPAEQQLLKTKHVLVAGCGGLGGYILEFLLRLGVGKITAVDGDSFDISNLNRQLLCEMPLLGTPKTEAAALRAAAVNPDVAFHSVCARINESNASALIAECDVVIDALDNIEGRKCLFAACSQSGIPFIHGAIGGWNVQAAICMPQDSMLDILYPPKTQVKTPSVLSFTPALCAALQVSLCTQLLCGRPVETGKLYLYDLLHMEGSAFTL